MYLLFACTCARTKPRINGHGGLPISARAEARHAAAAACGARVEARAQLEQHRVGRIARRRAGAVASVGAGGVRRRPHPEAEDEGGAHGLQRGEELRPAAQRGVDDGGELLRAILLGASGALAR